MSQNLSLAVDSGKATIRLRCTIPTWSSATDTCSLMHHGFAVFYWCKDSPGVDLYDLHELKSRALDLIHELLLSLRSSGVCHFLVLPQWSIDAQGLLDDCVLFTCTIGLVVLHRVWFQTACQPRCFREGEAMQTWKASQCSLQCMFSFTSFTIQGECYTTYNWWLAMSCSRLILLLAPSECNCPRKKLYSCSNRQISNVRHWQHLVAIFRH